MGKDYSAEAVIKVLTDGAKNKLWDGMIKLLDRFRLWINYDGGHWHNEKKLPTDIEKTQHILEENEEDLNSIKELIKLLKKSKMKSEKILTQIEYFLKDSDLNITSDQIQKIL